MEKRIGIIGHVDHGKTTLSSAIQTVLSGKSETYTIEDTYKDTRMGPTVWGFENTSTRRERRADERKTKKKWKNKSMTNSHRTSKK